MTVIENLENDADRWGEFADLNSFEKMRAHRDGQMPVCRDRAKHRGFRRASTYRRRKAGQPVFVGR